MLREGYDKAVYTMCNLVVQYQHLDGYGYDRGYEKIRLSHLIKVGTLPNDSRRISNGNLL